MAQADPGVGKNVVSAMIWRRRAMSWSNVSCPWAGVHSLILDVPVRNPSQSVHTRGSPG